MYGKGSGASAMAMVALAHQDMLFGNDSEPSQAWGRLLDFGSEHTCSGATLGAELHKSVARGVLSWLCNGHDGSQASRWAPIHS